MSSGPILIASAVYVALLLVLGVMGRRARHGSTLSEHYLAGRNIGFVVLLLTLFATQYSGNSLSGFPGQTYRRGLVYFMSVTFMVAIVSGYLLYAPRLFGLARQRKYLTPTDYLSERYGSSLLDWTSIVIFVFVLGNFLLAQMMALGHAFTGITNGEVSYGTAVVAGGVVILGYELLGGMRAVAWTDALQGTLLIAGILLIVVLLAQNFGGPVHVLGELRSVAPAKVANPDWSACWRWLSNLMLLGLGGPLYPQAIQRIYAARGLPELRRALTVMALLPLLAVATVVYIGLVGLLLFPGLEGVEADRISFLVIGELARVQPSSQFVVMLVMMAVVAAIMSTADSCLLSLGSVLTRDVAGRLRHAQAGQIEALQRYTPILSLAAMALITGIAMQPRITLWGLLVLKFEILIQLSPAFVLGTLHRPGDPRGIGAGPILAGLFGGLALFAGLQAAGIGDLGGFHSGSLSVLCNYAIAMAAWRSRML